MPGDQPSKFRWSTLVRPVQVQVLRERFVELPEGEALDVRIGNVQTDIVDAFVEPKVLERREFHGRSSSPAKINLWPFLFSATNKKGTGRGSQRPTGVRGGGDPEGIRPLGPEFELEAPAGFGGDLPQETALRPASPP